ncbi:hypothetical protein PENSPDRAFT_659889 [Peniophora sp. CONT]|nr:hypothetical protein PENSPDRAFT_659889 [Peniophora sp. CONT]
MSQFTWHINDPPMPPARPMQGGGDDMQDFVDDVNEGFAELAAQGNPFVPPGTVLKGTASTRAPVTPASPTKRPGRRARSNTEKSESSETAPPKKRPPRRKKNTSKQVEDEGTIDLTLDDDDEVVVKRENVEDEKPSKARKAKQTNESKTVPIEKVEWNVWIHVKVPKRGNTAAQVVHRGPINMTVLTSWDDFQARVALAVNTSKHGGVRWSDTQWHLEKPQNAPWKALSEQGYVAMIKSLRDLPVKQRCDVHLEMPPPSSQLHSWESANSNAGAAITTPATQAARENLTALTDDHKSFLQDLENKYPVGNDARFPHKRVYEHKAGYLLELTKLRLQVWAFAKDEPGVTLDDPPNKPSHFGFPQRLDPKSAASQAPVTPMAPAPAYVAPAAPSDNNLTMMMLFAALMGNRAPPVASSGSTSDTAALAAQLLAAQPHLAPVLQPLLQPAPSSPNATALASQLIALRPDLASSLQHVIQSGGPANEGPSTSAGSQAGRTLGSESSQPRPCPVRVPLSAFCKRYGLSDEDERRLGLIKYKPGNRHIESLDSSVWQGKGEFEALEWAEILDAHHIFLTDVTGGVWDEFKI